MINYVHAQKYEAESGYLSDSAYLCRDGKNSSCQYVHFEESGKIEWKIPIQKSGYYKIEIGYRAPEGEKEAYLLKNGKSIPIGLAISKDWAVFAQPFYLKKGIADIGLARSWSHLDIDYINIVPTFPSPEITPKQILFYKTKPTDIVLKVDNYNLPVKEVRCEGKKLDFSSIPYPYQESSVYVQLSAKSLSLLSEGAHSLLWTIGNRKVHSVVHVKKALEQYPLQIWVPYVEHGSAVIVRCPDNAYLMIDDGKDWVRDSILIPLIKKIGIDTIQTFILTHYDHDHDAGDSAHKLRTMFHVQNFIDYDSVYTGQQWREHGLDFTILNSASDGQEENTKSLSFLIKYKGFTYLHSADNYALNQDAILKRGENVKADVFYGNHHFHGSTDPKFIESVAPKVIVFQSQEAIYARSAYMTDVKKRAVPALNKAGVFVDVLPTLEVGTVIFRVKDKNNWSYETEK